MNYINPLDFSAKILENKNARFNIRNVNVAGDKITIDGMITDNSMSPMEVIAKGFKNEKKEIFNQVIYKKLESHE